jgi:hypothetical protein
VKSCKDLACIDASLLAADGGTDACNGNAAFTRRPAAAAGSQQ